MFGRMGSTYSGPGQRIENVGHVAALGLGVPLGLALVGGFVGGFSMALLGLGVGIAGCAVVVLTLSATTVH